jgi:hypothetical protein
MTEQLTEFQMDEQNNRDVMPNETVEIDVDGDFSAAMAMARRRAKVEKVDMIIWASSLQRHRVLPATMPAPPSGWIRLATVHSEDFAEAFEDLKDRVTKREE